jgi:hypothetical protein
MARTLIYLVVGIVLAGLAIALMQAAPLGSESRILLLLLSLLLVGAGAVPVMLRSPATLLRNLAIWVLLLIGAAGLYVLLYGS